jgi:D-alanyl-lipoteichoic acid acyltransferase DltB (MBOAT superfamily)
MNFTSPLYFYFIVSIFLFFRIASKIHLGQAFLRSILLIASYCFYAAWNPTYVLLIAVPTISDFLLGNQIYKSSGRKQKLYLLVSLCFNLSVLGFFKYANFLLGIENSLVSMLNISHKSLVLDLILPAGISFYTFQSMSYTIDIYRGLIRPELSIFQYALYLSFFPQLVAGPIVVARELLPKLKNLGSNLDIPYPKVFWLLLLGFTKKAIIADRIAPIIDIMYANPLSFSALDWVLCVLGYSVQIFCDFSGYTDIARGSALLFGVVLPENFNLPYLAESFSDFWRRWHITLSTWLRDYLYISLGGNRGTVIQTSFNLMVTMLLGGLWHGASWNFVLWGGGHGILLSLERYFQNSRFSPLPVGSTGSFYQKTSFLTFLALRRMLVFGCITLLWILFRSKSIDVSLDVLSKLFSLQGGFILGYTDRNFLLGNILVVFFSHLIGFFYADQISAYLEREPEWKLGVFFMVWAYIAVSLSRESRPFLYFVF